MWTCLPLSGLCALALSAMANGQSARAADNQLPSPQHNKEVAGCASISAIFATGCAKHAYTPTDVANASEYLSPSLGAGAATCVARNLAQFRLCITGILPPGAIVEVSSQMWPAPGSFAINGTGTARAPVTICAQHQGGVSITGKANFAIKGSYVRFEGFTFSGPETENFNDSAIDIGYSPADQCNHCLVSSAVFNHYDHTDGSGFTLVVAWGRWNRIANSNFDGKTSISTVVAINNLHADPSDHTLIDHNYFANRPSSGASSGYEAIVVGNGWEVGQSAPYDNFRTSGCIIKDNLFYKMNGSVNVISLKSGGCIVRNNTFDESGVVDVSMRESDNNIVEGNIFDGQNANMTGGVLLRGTGHLVIHNIFQNLSPHRPDGDHVWAVPVSAYAGDPLWHDNSGLYKTATNATIAFNTFASNNPSTLAEWIVGSPAVNTSSGSITQPSGIRFVQNIVANNANIHVLKSAPGSVVSKAANLCSAGIADAACSGVGNVSRSGRVYLPIDTASPAISPSRSAYAALGLPLAQLQQFYYITLFPGRTIKYSYLTTADVGPQHW